jgi:hypothetical protein
MGKPSMRRKDNIPTGVLDKPFGIEPDPNQEPMTNDWFEQHEQSQRDDEAKYQWMSEKARVHQQHFFY